MQHTIPFLSLAIGLALPFTAHAQEQARVVFSTPVIQVVGVPQQVCSPGPTVMVEPTPGAGAALGDKIDGTIRTVQQPTLCSAQLVQQNQITHYNVVYEYAGIRYSVQMPSDPGAFVAIQITPVAAVPPLASAPPAMAAPTVTVVNPVPVYAPPYPYAYGPGFYRPYPFSFSFGFYGGHRRWR